MQYEFYLNDVHLDSEESPMILFELISNMRECARNGHDIRLYIQTGGGNYYHMLVIMDTINSLPCKVDMIAIGECMSAGLILLATNLKGERLVTPNTVLMWHGPQVGSHGNIHDVKHDIEFHDRHFTKIRQIICDRTGWTQEHFIEMFEQRDTFMDSEEAVQLGFADRILYSDCEGVYPETEQDSEEPSDSFYG